jgi:dTDP-4-amino-4,6-dideoxy-D-galactose acyltransferase
MEDFKLLEWDSQFFGYKVAAIKADALDLPVLKNILVQLREKDFKLAYCYVAPEDKKSRESISQVSALLADEKITYTIKISDEASFPVSEYVVPYDLNFTSDKIVTLALDSGLYSRFKIDPDFQNNEFERLYTEWIKKSVNKLVSNEVLIYREDQDILGFITLAFKNNAGSIGLIAVDENQRGKSIGKKLIGSALLYFKENKVTEVDVVTQKANKIACRFYETCGFKIKSIVNIYHLWIK